MRRYVIAFLIGSMVVLNPIVFSLAMPAVAGLFGPGGEAFATENQMWMTAIATAYSLAALSAVFAMRRGNQPIAGAIASSRKGAELAPDAPYHGPGGGKKRPKGGPRVNTGKRPRTRLTRNGSGKGARQARGR